MKRSKSKAIQEEVSQSRKRRTHRESKFNESSVNLINCHCCKTVDSALNMITCCRANCRESFCINCIKKTYVKFNSNFFLILKEKEATNIWKCYKCSNRCPCKECEKARDKEEQRPKRGMLKRKRLASRMKRTASSQKKSSPSTNNNITKVSTKETTTLPEKKKNVNIGRPRKKKRQYNKNTNEVLAKTGQMDESKIKDTIKIDEFFIYECEAEEKEKEEDSIQKEDEHVSDEVTQPKKGDKIKILKDVNFNMFNDKQPLSAKGNKKPHNFKRKNNNKIPRQRLMIHRSQNSKNEEELMDRMMSLFPDDDHRNYSSQATLFPESLFSMMKSNEELVKNENGMNIENTANNENKEVNQFNPEQKTISTFQQNPPIIMNRQRPLTKPCNVCGNSHFEKFEILKFQYLTNFLQSLKSHLDKRGTLTPESIKILCMELDMTGYVRNDDNFQKNKEAYWSFFEKFSKGEVKQENTFKRTKRICKCCIFTNMEKENGMNLLLDAVHEEDEQAVLDQNKKEEIIKNIQAFFCHTGSSNVNPNTLMDNKSEGENDEEEVYEKDNNKSFNIFNNIFNRRKLDDEEMKLLADLKIKSESQTEQDIKYKEVFKVLAQIDGNLNFLNDNKNAKTNPNVNMNYINININKFPQQNNSNGYNYNNRNKVNNNSNNNNNNNNNKNYYNNTNNNAYKNLNNYIPNQISNTNSYSLENSAENEDPTVELISLLSKVRNQMAFSQFFNVIQKNMINGIFGIVEAYLAKMAHVIKENANSTAKMIELLDNFKKSNTKEKAEVAGEGQSVQVNETSQSVDKFTSEMDKFLQFQKINSVSCTLLNMFKTIVFELKVQNDNLTKNDLYSEMPMQDPVGIMKMTTEKKNNNGVIITSEENNQNSNMIITNEENNVNTINEENNTNTISIIEEYNQN